MKRLICIFLSALMLVGLIPLCVTAKKSDIKVATAEMFNSEFGYDTCKVYLNKDKWLMDISDVARYTRTSFTVHEKTIKLTHGTRKINIDMEKGNVSENGINFNIITYQLGDKNLVHAFPLLSYLGAECGIEDSRLIINMPQSTLWEGLVRSSNENYFTLETFGEKFEQNTRLFLNAILKILESGLSDALFDNSMKNALIEVMQIDPLKYDGSWEIKEATDKRYSSMISAMISANDFAPDFNDVFNGTESLVSNIAIEYLKGANENDALYLIELEGAKGLFDVVSTVSSFLSNLSTNSKCTVDSLDMVKAFSKHTAKNSKYYIAAKSVQAKVESELSSTLDAARDVAKSKIAEKFVDKANEQLRLGKSGYLSITALIEESVNISVMLHKLIYGDNNAFAYSSSETNAINMLLLKNELLKDIDNLGKKILSDNYTNAKDINDYRLLNIFYYRTLIAANEQLEDMIVAQGRENEPDMKAVINNLHNNNNIFSKNLYRLTVSRSKEFANAKELSKSNEWDSFEDLKNKAIEFNETNVVDAVNYSKNVILTPELAEIGYDVEGQTNDVRLPKISSETSNAKAFNKKLYDTFGYQYERLLNNREGGNLLKCDYEYKEYNDILGIVINTTVGAYGAGANSNYYAFYFDINQDKELTFDEYLKALDLNQKLISTKIKNTSVYKDYYSYISEYNNVYVKDCILGTDGSIVFMNDIDTMNGWNRLDVESMLE